MLSESSHKFYYRYVISENEPFSKPSHDRKIQKAQHHPTTDLLVDLVSTQDLKQALKFFDFPTFQEQSPFKAHFLIRPGQLKDFQTLTQKFPTSFLFLMETQQDFQVWLTGRTDLPVLLSPKTNQDLQLFVQEFPLKGRLHFWSFKPYDSKVKRSVSLKDIYQTQIRSQIKYPTLSGLEIWNIHIPSHHELELASDPFSPVPLSAKNTYSWSFKTPTQDLQVSVVIPSFNNVTFLANVLQHLFQQTLPRDKYEIIVVEDGGQDKTLALLRSLFENYKDQVNLRIIYWPKNHPERGEQNFFRAGLSRNLAVRFCTSEKLIFLDSDMLVPENFLQTACAELERNDLIQFQRYHIHQELSRRNPQYKSIRLHTDTYIEEKNYWSQLFQSENWMSLPHYWKFTCTYALGMHRSKFYEVGRFKKYYVSYGFEDTDLGYEFFKRGHRFKLIKMPLLHLTAYDRMQYKNSQIQRLKLLRKTAALFYLQHLTPEIYELFGNFYRFEKPVYHTLRDLF